MLDKGKVVQEGTHNDLVAEPGAYRDLFEAQSPETSTLALNHYCTPCFLNQISMRCHASFASTSR